MKPRRADAEPFPWREAMAFGLGVLKLAPADFWSMTPRELSAALAGALPAGAGREPLPRTALEALMQRFPDQSMEDG
ncbi:MAG: phage tail assembly chaperone [Hyphomicrobiaceae bacterium]